MEYNNKTALLLGATGLIGGELLKLLLLESEFSKVIIFVRKSVNISNPRLTEHIIDFNSPEKWEPLVVGDTLFMAFGTTIKKAGSKENQYKIDVHYQHDIAKAAALNKVKSILLVSSTGANSKSRFFYKQIKGKLDDMVKKLAFSNTTIFKPSVLVGKRTDKRKGESAAIIIMKAIAYLPFFKKYKPIEGKTVAKAMIIAAQLEQAQEEYVLNEIQDLTYLTD